MPGVADVADVARVGDKEREEFASSIEPMLTKMIAASLREMPQDDVEGFFIDHLKRIRAERIERDEKKNAAVVQKRALLRRSKTVTKIMKLRNLLLKAAEGKHDASKCVAFIVLCGDDSVGSHVLEGNVMVETDDTVRYWAVCPGVSTEELTKPRLSAAAASSIMRTIAQVKTEAQARGLEVTGITGDRPFWLKHQGAIRTMLASDSTAVYMSTLIQLPMVAAAFKNCEKVLIVTFGRASEFSMWKTEVLESSGISVENLDRLIVISASELSPEWSNFSVGGTTPEQEKTLGEQILEAVRKRVAEENNVEKMDMFVKAIILSPKVSMFAQLLREETELPVFDELTLLKFFGSGKALSHYSEAKRLKQLVAPKKQKDGSDSAPSVGLLRLEYHYPPALGDLDHEGTFGFRIAPRTVDGLFFEKAQAGSMEQHIMDNMAKCIKELEDDEKVIGITANCGFMMFYQCFARYVARVPVFMSSLVQAQSIVSGLLPHERVLILTANSESLAPGKDTMLQNSGINVTDSDIYLIEGLQDLEGFEAVAEGARVDTIKVQNNLVERIKGVIEREKAHMPIRCILCECTELPHFSDSLREATGLMVFDSVTVVNFFYEATANKNWNTKTFSAHNQTWWTKRYDAEGHHL